MHELSIAVSIVEIATEEAERRGGARIEAVHLKLGALSGVVKDSLMSAYEIACANSPIAGARLVVEEVPAVIYCDVCQAEREIESIQEFRCPGCGTFTANVVGGRELEVVALEIEA